MHLPEEVQLAGVIRPTICQLMAISKFPKSISLNANKLLDYRVTLRIGIFDDYLTAEGA